MPAALLVLAGHVEPVGGVALQRVDLEGPVGGQEVLHDAGVGAGGCSTLCLNPICQITSNHPDKQQNYVSN